MVGSVTELTGSGRSTTPRQVLLIVCAGVVLASLDLFVVNVALPQIARGFHTSNLGSLSWVLNGYAIVYASLLVFFGRLADRHRLDRGFLLGVAVFTAASAACALSTSVAMLVGFRLVQATGAALLTPTSLGLVLASYEPQKRHGAVRAWTAVGGLAAALGPVVGGILVTASWRWVFLVNVPIGIVTLIAGWRRLPAVQGRAVGRPDPIGVVLATAGIAAVTSALVEGSSWGWGSVRVIGLLVGAAALLAAFTVHCSRSAKPLVPPGLFRSRPFTGASIVALTFSAGFGAMLLSLVLWAEGGWGWSALRTGLAVAPGPLMVPLISFLVAGRLIARFGPAVVLTAGTLTFAGGVSWWALGISSHPDYVTGVLGGMLLTGVGVGLTLPTFMATASSSLPAESFATGSAVVNMIRQTGLALGVAVLVAVLGDGTGHGAAVLPDFRRGWWVTAAMAAASVVPALALLRRGSQVAPSAATAGSASGSGAPVVVAAEG